MRFLVSLSESRWVWTVAVRGANESAGVGSDCQRLIGIYHSWAVSTQPDLDVGLRGEAERALAVQRDCGWAQFHGHARVVGFDGLPLGDLDVLDESGRDRSGNDGLSITEPNV